jgi:hypothetical protein
VRSPADDRLQAAANDLALVLRPSFWLSFLLADLLDGRAYFGAEVAVLSSASSKAALGTSRLLSGRLRTIGLTSAARVQAVSETGAYEQVASYDDVARLQRANAVYLDFASRQDVTAAVHGHFGPLLRYSALAGFTQGVDAPAAGAMPGSAPQLFFVPDYIRIRAGEIGMPVLSARFEEALAEFAGWCGEWLEVAHVAGAANVASAYLALLDGDTPVSAALICSL